MDCCLFYLKRKKKKTPTSSLQHRLCSECRAGCAGAGEGRGSGSHGQ